MRWNGMGWDGMGRDASFGIFLIGVGMKTRDNGIDGYDTEVN